MQKKTKIMDLDNSPTTTIDVDGEQLENVNNFVYIGSRIDGDGKSSPDIRRRIAIAISKMNTIAPLWKTQSTELKWRFLKACIFPGDGVQYFTTNVICPWYFLFRIL